MGKSICRAPAPPQPVTSQRPYLQLPPTCDFEGEVSDTLSLGEQAFKTQLLRITLKGSSSSLGISLYSHEEHGGGVCTAEPVLSGRLGCLLLREPFRVERRGYFIPVLSRTGDSWHEGISGLKPGQGLEDWTGCPISLGLKLLPVSALHLTVLAPRNFPAQERQARR